MSISLMPSRYTRAQETQRNQGSGGYIRIGIGYVVYKIEVKVRFRVFHMAQSRTLQIKSCTSLRKPSAFDGLATPGKGLTSRNRRSPALCEV